MKVNDGAHPEQVTHQWNRALSAYAAAVATELRALRVQVIDWFVDVAEAPFWIDVAVVDPAGHLVEFHFSDDLGWLHANVLRCGRLTVTIAPTATARATEVALPPSLVAAHILRALAGHEWATEPLVGACTRSLDPHYLTALLAVLEGRVI